MINANTQDESVARKEWSAPQLRRLMASEAETGVAGFVDLEGMS